MADIVFITVTFLISLASLFVAYNRKAQQEIIGKLDSEETIKKILTIKVTGFGMALCAALYALSLMF